MFQTFCTHCFYWCEVKNFLGAFFSDKVSKTTKFREWNEMTLNTRDISVVKRGGHLYGSFSVYGCWIKCWILCYMDCSFGHEIAGSLCLGEMIHFCSPSWNTVVRKTLPLVGAKKGGKGSGSCFRIRGKRGGGGAKEPSRSSEV